jgi:cell wall-associated NlpC family hydrolase
MTRYQIITPSAPMRHGPDSMSGLETDALFGESVTILDEGDKGWVRVRLETDGYEAWVERDMLGELPPPTHRVMVARSLITNGRDIKTPSLGYLPMAAQILVLDHDDNVAEIALAHDAKGYVPLHHLMTADTCLDDWVLSAEQLMGTPYRWGGRDSIGIDCSALVQLALSGSGIPSPRNSGDQEKTLGEAVADHTVLARGDLIFWKGHVGIMQDSTNLLHANAWHNMVMSEPLSHAVDRIMSSGGGPVTRMVRMPVMADKV